MAFLIGQRPFIKLYILHILDQRQSYGLEMISEVKRYLKEEGYTPPQSEIYRGLNELVTAGIIETTHRIKKDHNGSTGDFQEIILYKYTIDGRQKAEMFKREVKLELDRCIGMLKQARKDNFK
ncbi:helix-turn-helix transcriptional regulator [Paenibacillus bovis]|uniref:Replication termination protein n=1 Tax=Paenibacillus bovis TaxID=1616788 RepID=A0A1X9T432_9BACL|nr:helix-turn-helix transcriptional regulator [Paenibacillus bovis]ARR10698.1 Replication termination protein [Paenibacillus bovis]